MTLAVKCSKCGRAYRLAESQAGKVLRCKQCGGEIVAPRVAVTATMAATAGGGGATAEVPVVAAERTLAYASAAVGRNGKWAAFWCSMTAAGWIIAVMLRVFLNSVCGIAPERGEFLGVPTALSTVVFTAALAGDVVIFLASVAMAAAATYVRQGDERWMGRAAVLTWVQFWMYGMGVGLLACLLGSREEFIVPMVVMLVLGFLPFVGSGVTRVLLKRLARLPGPEMLNAGTVEAVSPARLRAGTACVAGAAIPAMLLAVLAISGILAEMGKVGVFPAVLLVVLCVGHVLCGRWIQRGGYGAIGFALGLAGSEMMGVYMASSAAAEWVKFGRPYGLFAAASLVVIAAGAMLLVFQLLRALRRRPV